MASLLSTGKAYERLGNFPLDASSIQLTLADAIDYATNNPTAYSGQLIYIIDSRTQDEIEEYSKQVKEKYNFIKQNKDTTNAYVNKEQTEYNDLDRFYM